MTTTASRQPAAGTFLRVDGPADPLPRALRGKIARRQRRAARHGLAAEIITRYGGGRWLHLMRPVIEDAHRSRDRLAGRPCDLDDAATLAAWRGRWDAACAAGSLELSALYFRQGQDGPPQLAAYCAAIRDERHRALRVIDSRMAGVAWGGYGPGRWLEAERVTAAWHDPAWDLIDWGAGGHPSALLATS